MGMKVIEYSPFVLENTLRLFSLFIIHYFSEYENKWGFFVLFHYFHLLFSHQYSRLMNNIEYTSNKLSTMHGDLDFKSLGFLSPWDLKVLWQNLVNISNECFSAFEFLAFHNPCIADRIPHSLCPPHLQHNECKLAQSHTHNRVSQWGRHNHGPRHGQVTLLGMGKWPWHLHQHAAMALIGW